jgi:N-acyl-D-aspartate/D-glutamate deacylase
MAADVVVLDEDAVDSDPLRTRADLPGGASRLYAASRGIAHVIVNGDPIVSGGELAGALPGAVLRSGRDTVTASLTWPPRPLTLAG